MRNTADVTGKPIAVLLQSISGISVINLLVAFYDIHGRKREVLFFYFFPNATRDSYHYVVIKIRQLFLRPAACRTSILFETEVATNDC
jgi:hypothetical protein